MNKVKNWEELAKCTSESYYLDINLEYGKGWIRPKFKVSSDDYYNHNRYLSTHTFDKVNRELYSELLQKYGFDVELIEAYQNTEPTSKRLELMRECAEIGE